MDSQRTLIERRAPPEPTLEAPTRRILGHPASGAPPPRELVLERYRLHERLGAGGFGVVWRASDELLQREVALKRIPLGAGDDGERAMREALACARLSHPAVVALYEACVRDGAMYLISELVEGSTLANLIADGSILDSEVLEIGIALCGALAHAHARGVVHRDIKPQNVLVPDRREQPPQPAKLTDFGGASLAGEDILTRTGDVLGTLAYMSPEQSEGKPAGEPADVYALALVLYEALTGDNPVRGDNPAETARRIGRPVEPLRRRRPDLPSTLSDAIDAALVTRPQGRCGLGPLRTALEDARLHREQGATRPRREAVVGRREAHAGHDEYPGHSEYPGHGTQARRGAVHARGVADPHRAPAHGSPEAGLASEPRAESEPNVVVHAGEAPRTGAPRRLALAGLVALCCWEAIAGRPGLSLVLLVALLPALLVLSGHGRSGRVPVGRLSCALAPLLGMVGLAGAFPALAGQARTPSERALRGALGYWWITLAGPLVSVQLWLPAPAGMPATGVWEESVGQAATHVIAPALTMGVLLGALLWGAAAMVLPWIVRGREPLLDAIAAGLWALALVLVQPMLDGGLAGGAHNQPRGAVLGALLGACMALAGRALRGPAARQYA